MKVLHVMPSTSLAFGGPVHALAGFVEAGNAAGIDSSLLGPAGGDDWLLSRFAPERRHVFRAFGSGAFSISPTLQLWLRANVRRYDVVHVHGLLNPISSLAARSAIGCGVPLVLRPFGTLSQFTFEHRRRIIKRIYLRFVDARALRRAGAVHFTTWEEVSEAAQFGDALVRRAAVLPPPLPSDAWPSRLAFDIERPPTAIMLSRLHPVKNVELLLRAWRDVKRRYAHARLIIAGDGEREYVDRLRGLAATLGLQGVTFVGFVHGTAKADLLANADVFVLPSFHESFGVAVLEAIAAGIPVVISSSVQLANFVREHNLGMVVEPEPCSVASAISQIMADVRLRTHVRSHGPAVAAAHFSPAAVADALRRMYDAAMSCIP
jgi:glycosyltransferase involved in cell wall biosynthesis